MKSFYEYKKIAFVEWQFVRNSDLFYRKSQFFAVYY